MRMNLRQSVWILAVVLSMGIAGGAVRAAPRPSPQYQDQQDYSKNKKYQQGMREGQNDRKRNLNHSKKRHFKKDNDQKAYDSGYQRSYQGDQRR